MNLSLVEQPFVLKLTNDTGSTTLFDAAESIGGKNLGIRPMELLAGSIAACISIDVLQILRKQRFTITHYNVGISFTRKNQQPASFESIQLTFEVKEEIPINRLQKAVELSQTTYCSAWHSMHPSIQLIINYSTKS